MTTKFTLKNAACSNGDIHLVKSAGFGTPTHSALSPGQSVDDWISTGHVLTVQETWPTNAQASDLVRAGESADNFIATEVAIQDRMWGPANERADAANNQLMNAGLAQLVLVSQKIQGETSDDAVEIAREFYPVGWSGFRDYGSNIANLVVAVAFLRSEIKRRLLAGEDTTRAARKPEQPYNADTGLPYVSSSEIINGAEPLK